MRNRRSAIDGVATMKQFEPSPMQEGCRAKSWYCDRNFIIGAHSAQRHQGNARLQVKVAAAAMPSRVELAGLLRRRLSVMSLNSWLSFPPRV